MRSLARLLRGEADEAADNAQGNLKRLKHKFKGNNSTFKECKKLLSSQVSRNKMAREKTFSEREGCEQREQPNFEHFVAEKLQTKPKQEKPAKDRPLVFIDEPRRQLTEKEREEKRKERQRRKNRKRCEKLRLLKKEAGNSENAKRKRPDNPKRDARPK